MSSMASYHGTTLNDPVTTKKLMMSLSKKLKGVIPKKEKAELKLIGTGLSGVHLCAQLSIVSGFAWAFIRKPNDISHHGEAFSQNAISCHGEGYVIVDDFISSGETVDRVADWIHRHSNGKILAVALLTEIRRADSQRVANRWKVPVVCADSDTAMPEKP